MDLDWKPPTFETERLVIRPVEIADASDIFLFSSNPRMTRFTLWESHQTIDDTMLFLKDYALTRYASRVLDPIAITLKDDPTQSVVGTVGCFWASKQDGVMELGYNLAEPYWGRGLIVEAARPLIDYAFANCECERLQARVLFGNNASGRVAEKLGMTYEGTLRSALLVRGQRTHVQYYSLLRPDWARTRSTT